MLVNDLHYNQEYSGRVFRLCLPYTDIRAGRITACTVVSQGTVHFKQKTLLHGLILAVLITGNMLFEKLGLEHLEASAASVFASMNIVFVPLILVLLKKYPSRNHYYISRDTGIETGYS